MRGTVKWFDENKGYGFIALDGGGKDVFMGTHDIQLENPYDILTPGDKVSFEVVGCRKGPVAKGVTRTRHYEVPKDFP